MSARRAVEGPEIGGDALNELLSSRLIELRETAPPGFAVRVVRPFVVASDEPMSALTQRIDRVLEPAIAWLEQTYFRDEPSDVVAIWLCADAASYDRTARDLTGFPPSTPFGFYSEEHRSVVLDASTGDGTIVHEILHPLLRADFAACPTWLDEGLGAMYERCAFEGGALRGLVNWRLEALRRAAAERRVPTVAALFRMTPEEFYGDDSALNYAAARYLCLFLQERGALAELYRRLRDAGPPAGDPAMVAEKAVADLLGAPGVAEVDTAFRAWVMRLSAG